MQALPSRPGFLSGCGAGLETTGTRAMPLCRRQSRMLWLRHSSAVLKAVVKLTDEPVEEVACGCSVTVAVFSSTAAVLACRLTVGGSGECPHPAEAASLSFLIRRWVIEMERPEARVTDADPA